MTDELNKPNPTRLDAQIEQAFQKASLKIVERNIQDLHRGGVNLPWKRLMKLVDAPELMLLEAAESQAASSNEPAKAPATNTQLVDVAVIRKSELLDKLNIKKSTLGNWLKKGGPYYDPTFPQPVYFNKSPIPHWFVKDIVRWIEAQAAKRAA